MPIPFYNLHDQTAEQMADELIRQIPANTPEWRNPAPGDPGRTLIDLFAWMGDKLLYRINLLPERQRLMFLQLLDIPMRAAVPATGLLQLRHAAPKDMGRVVLPARGLAAGPVDFETMDVGHILPVEGMVYSKRRPDSEEAASVADMQAGLESVYDLEASSAYVSTPLFSNGKPISDGFDVATDSIDQSLWVAILSPEPMETPEEVESLRETIFKRDGSAPVLMNLGFAPPADVPLMSLELDAPRPKPENWMWQMPTGDTLPDGMPEYTTLAPAVMNTTDGFNRTGVIQLSLPDFHNIGLPENNPDIDVLAGVGDRPPRIDDPEIAARLLTWVRLRPKTPATTLPVSWMGINTVSIEQRVSLTNIILGRAASGSGRQMNLPAQNVDPDSFILDVQRSDGMFETWMRTDDLAGHGGTEKVFKLDAEAGVISFGDGVRGAVPSRNAKVRAALLRHGGGRAGNIPAQTLEKISNARLKASQPIATYGGEDAETLAQAEERLPSLLRHNDRCVTESDFKDLAPLTPGVDLARVEILPRFRPFQRLSNVAGAVSVMVIPQAKQLAAPNPRPDRGILTAVTDFLDQRRLIGTELHVIGPEYRPLSVSTSVDVKEGFEPDVVLTQVEDALRAFLAPVAPGGRDGTGWKLGRSVTNLELDVIISQVEGLEAVFGVHLFERADDGSAWELLPKEGNGMQTMEFERWMLPELAEVLVTQDTSGASDTMAVGSGGSTGGGSGDDLPTPIPVVPEMC